MKSAIQLARSKRPVEKEEASRSRKERTDQSGRKEGKGITKLERRLYQKRRAVALEQRNEEKKERETRGRLDP